MTIVMLLIGLLLGVVLGYLIFRLQSRQGLQSEEIERQFVRKERFEDLQQRLQRAEEEQSASDKENLDLAQQVSTWKERHNGLDQKLKEQKEELEKLQEKFRNDFKVLAQEILDKTGQSFKEQNKEQLGVLLNPFKEKLESFEKKVEETYEKGKKETIELKSEVKLLSEQSAKLSKDAEDLTKALKGDVKAQGNWGELVLERILEKSGLTKDQEYFTQESFTNEEGKRFQPDVVIKLPEDKNIIVDSKVSLIAYDRFANAESQEEQEAALKEHLNSIKIHVKGLSEKNYQDLYGVQGLDFVLLFIPIEGAFSIAVQADNNLFQEAFDKNVVIVSTSTLLATLRTIASIWKQEKQTQNALEIARQGGNLYDKFVGLADDLIALGKQMRTAQGTYEDTMKKLSTGNGNLVKRAEDLRKLGLKTSKQLDQKLIDRAAEDEE